MPPLIRKPIIMGEANPYGGDPGFALCPYPEGCSGHRLCCKILRMRRATYLNIFERFNLCEQDWDMKEARVHASAITHANRKPLDRLILLGAKVSRAFGIDFKPFSFVMSELRGARFLVLPHPSGRNTIWNNPGTTTQAREAVLELCPELKDHIGAV